MQKVKIIFKSGAVEEVVVKKFLVRKNGLGDIIEIDWENAENKPGLMYLNLNQIACISYKNID